MISIFVATEPGDDYILAHAMDAWVVLYEIDQKIRNQLKYHDMSEEVEKALQEVRDNIHDYLRERGCDLYAAMG